MIHIYFDFVECDKIAVDTKKLSNAFGKEYVDSLNEKRSDSRRESLCGAALLLKLLKKAGITTGKGTVITRNEFGKPEFPVDSDLHFSIAHSDGSVVCVLSRGAPIGADIQCVSQCELKQKKYLFDRISSRWLVPHGFGKEGDDAISTVIAWTKYEASSKFTGRTLAECKEKPQGTVLESFSRIAEERLCAISICRAEDSQYSKRHSPSALGFCTISFDGTKGRISVLGVEFDPLTTDESVELASRALLECRDRPLTIVTPNPVISMLCHEDEQYKNVINSSDLVLADGVGVVDASIRAGTPLPERVAGIDLGHRLLERASLLQKKVFLLGAGPGVAEKAAHKLRCDIPGIEICGVLNGYTELDDAIIKKALNNTHPELLIVCLGAPRQEMWVAEHHDLLKNCDIKVCICLGGALDVWSGNIRRAPMLFIKLKLEWLWRCLASPKKLGVLPLLVRYRLLTR